jgi:hypothetical protein
MKDLIMISSFCDTKEKEEILRNLVNQVNTKKDKFDLMVVSHTVVPDDISGKCDFVLYDKKNELLYEWDLRCKPWFNPNNQRQIISIFTGFFNTHLAIWRMIILGNSLAKNVGYNKVHHVEYDTSINDFSELIENSELLEKYDCVTYHKTKDNVDSLLFGTYQTYRLDTLHEDLLILNEEKIKNKILNTENKLPESMLFNLLHTNKNGFVKNKSLLDSEFNTFGLSHGQMINAYTAWCLPFYDRLTKKLRFVVWNIEEDSENVEVQVIYNNEKIINLGVIKPQNWVVKDIDDFDKSKKMVVILNNKIRNIFDFEKDGEMFKQVSFMEEFNKN